MLFVFLCVRIWINTCSCLLLAWNTSFKISCKMLTTNSVLVYLGLPIFHLPFRKTVLLDIRFLIDKCLFPPALGYVIPLPSSFRYFDEKSTAHPIGAPFYVTSHFSYCFQIFFFVFLHFYYDVLWVWMFLHLSYLECVGFLGYIN